jgi:3-oxoadipate enol-lactonase
MPTKTVNGAASFYDDTGNGAPPLVLVHGFPLDGRIFAHQAKELSRERRVICPDLRGFGRSQSGASFTIASLADDVHGLLKELDALPCVLGGLSMGGYVALAFAKKYASDLAGLILIDTRSEADTADGKAARDKMIQSARISGARAIADQMFPRMLSPQNQSREVGAAARQIMESQRPETIENALAAMRDREDYTGILRSIAVPALILVGEHDAITPPDMARQMNSAVPKSKLQIIPRAGHLSTMEQPAQVTAAIAGFLAGMS